MRASRGPDKKGGLTLVEVLVAGSLLVLFSTMIVHAMVLAFRAQRTGEEKVVAVRQGSITLDWMRRELSTTSSVFNPDPNASVNNWTPTVGDPLRIGRNSSAGQTEVWYWYDAADQVVRRWQAGELSGGRVVAREVKSFTISHLGSSPIFQARLSVSTVSQPLVATSRVLSL